MGEALFWYPLCTNSVEIYSNSHWAPVPAKILSHLGHFTERSCFVTQRGETDGEETNTEMSLIRVFFFLAFSLFSPLHGLSHSLCVYPASRFRQCGWLWIHLSLLLLAFLSLLSFVIPSIIETSHPPLLPIRSPNPTPGPAQAPGPLPPPRELNYVWWDPVRRRIRHSLDHDLHNPCSPEHPMWLPSVRADVPTCTHMKPCQKRRQYSQWNVQTLAQTFDFNGDGRAHTHTRWTRW